uniref:Uncharacterized protein n=1 Tax=Plectus sambesii TaxID=2011161 RepID=A0A914XPI8_9BILA
MDQAEEEASMLWKIEKCLENLKVQDKEQDNIPVSKQPTATVAEPDHYISKIIKKQSGYTYLQKYVRLLSYGRRPRSKFKPNVPKARNEAKIRQTLTASKGPSSSKGGQTVKRLNGKKL